MYVIIYILKSRPHVWWASTLPQVMTFQTLFQAFIKFWKGYTNVYLGVHVSICMYMSMCVCRCMLIEARGWHQVSFLSLSMFFFLEMGSLTQPWTHKFSSPNDLPPPGLGLPIHAATSSFYVCAGALNCTMSTLPTDPHPQLCYTLPWYQLHELSQQAEDMAPSIHEVWGHEFSSPVEM